MSNFNVKGQLKSTGGGNTLYPVDLVVERGNGYVRYYNGVQICWGIVSPSGNDQIHTVTYPKPFNSMPSPMIQKSGQKGWNSAWAPREWPSYFVHYDQTGFRIKATDWQSGTIFPWSVIGTWK